MVEADPFSDDFAARAYQQDYAVGGGR